MTCGCREQEALVVGALVDLGALPAFKAPDPDQALADRLTRRLQRAFGGVGDALEAELRSRRTLGAVELVELRALASSFQAMRELVARAGVEAARRSRRRVFADLRDQGGAVSFTAPDERVIERIYEREIRFADDSFRRVERDIRRSLATSYQRGLGIDDAARDLRKVVDHARDHRLRTIARTEIQGSQQDIAHETIRDLGVAYEQWITALDGRVRGLAPDDEADHNVLHGEVVLTSERFTNGLRYPGDRSGPISEWINCRCRVRPYLLGPDERVISTPYYP